MGKAPQKKIVHYMNKRRICTIVAVSVAVVIALTLFVGSTIYSVKAQVTQACFEELAIASKQLADELHMAIGSDHTTLSAIGTIIANQEEVSDEELSQIISSYDFDTTYISYLTILKPDNTMLFADGTVRDVSEEIDFADEAWKGEYISGVRQSKRDLSVKVVDHAVPIIKNGETLYILYGIVPLNNLAERYTTDLYGGHAYVYIEDGDNGDFILDTWHKTLGNIIDMGKRKMLPGYSLEQAIDDMSNGISGEIAFVSRTTGNVLYMRYEPLGVNNWNVMITVEEGYALAQSVAITRSLYLMAGICGAILLLYFAFVVFNLFDAYRQVKRIGSEDQNTGLLNRNAYDEYVFRTQDQLFPSISCVFVDINGLHAINNERGHAEGDKVLRTVADTLCREFDHNRIFRIGGDEFVAFSESDNDALCREKIIRITNEIEACGYSISSGIVSFKNETGLVRITKDADALMLDNKRQYYAEHDRRRV